MGHWEFLWSDWSERDGSEKHDNHVHYVTAPSLDLACEMFLSWLETDCPSQEPSVDYEACAIHVWEADAYDADRHSDFYPDLSDTCLRGYI